MEKIFLKDANLVLLRNVPQKNTGEYLQVGHDINVVGSRFPVDPYVVVSRLLENLVDDAFEFPQECADANSHPRILVYKRLDQGDSEIDMLDLVMERICYQTAQTGIKSGPIFCFVAVDRIGESFKDDVHCDGRCEEILLVQKFPDSIVEPPHALRIEPFHQ